MRKLVVMWGKSVIVPGTCIAESVAAQASRNESLRVSECESGCSLEVEELWGLCGAKESVSCPSVHIVKEPAGPIVFWVVL